MFRALKPYGIIVDGIYFCPHGLRSDCDCRKPRTALFERAARNLNLDLEHSFFAGDRTTDLEAARRLGILKILVKTGEGGKDGEFEVEPDYVAEDLTDLARWVLERERSAGD